MGLGTGTISGLLNGAATFSIHAWVYVASTTTAAFDNRILSTAINGTGNGLILSIDNTTANRLVRVDARSVSTDTLRSGTSTTNLALNTWHSVGGVVDIAGDAIQPYSNGAAEGGGAVTFNNAVYTNGTPAAQDRIGGHNATLTTASQLDGRIARLALWGGTLSANAFVALSRGASPLRVTANNGATALFFMPIWGLDSPEYCLVCGASGTISGSLPQANDPPVPLFSQIGRASMPTGDSFLPAWARNSNRLVGGGVWGG